MGINLSSRWVPVGIVLTTIAISSYFLASGTTALLAGKLFPPDASMYGSAADGADGASTSGGPDLKAILKRNIFDSSTGPLWPPQQPAGPSPDEIEGDGEDAPGEAQVLGPGEMPPTCEGTMRLVGSVHSEGFPEWSFATMSGGSDAPLLYRVGGTVGGHELTEIYPKAVFMRATTGSMCSVAMFVEEPKTAAKTSGPVTAKKAATDGDGKTKTTSLNRKTGGISPEELKKNISKVSDTKFTIKRELVNKVLENQAELMRSARIVPHEQNGQVVGVKLYGIRRQSLLGSLGLQNGDLLRTINGFDMSSPDTALEAYSRLRNASNLSLSVTRRGRPVAVDYSIEE